MSVSSPPHLKFLRSHDGNDDDAKPHPAARGPNALPQKLTPALIGAQRGHIHNCPTIDDASKAAYWNDPMGYSDMNFRSPFAAATSFSSSSGGTSGGGRKLCNSIFKMLFLLLIYIWCQQYKYIYSHLFCLFVCFFVKNPLLFFFPIFTAFVPF